MKRPTAQRANPRYLITRDGVEVGIYPGLISADAVKRAKAQHGSGKYTAKKIGADMYLGDSEKSATAERSERQREYNAYRAHRLSKAKRNPRNLATKEEMMRIIMSRKLDVHPYPRGKYPYTVEWKFRDGTIFAIEFPDRTALVDSQYLQRRNGTHIHAENIDHLDVSRVHNPEDEDDSESSFNRLRYKFIFIPVPGDTESSVYPIETEEETYEAQEAMQHAGLNTAHVMEYDNGEIIPTSLTLWQD